MFISVCFCGVLAVKIKSKCNVQHGRSTWLHSPDGWGNATEQVGPGLQQGRHLKQRDGKENVRQSGETGMRMSNCLERRVVNHPAAKQSPATPLKLSCHSFLCDLYKQLQTVHQEKTDGSDCPYSPGLNLMRARPLVVVPSGNISI